MEAWWYSDASSEKTEGFFCIALSYWSGKKNKKYWHTFMWQKRVLIAQDFNRNTMEEISWKN